MKTLTKLTLTALAVTGASTGLIALSSCQKDTTTKTTIKSTTKKVVVKTNPINMIRVDQANTQPLQSFEGFTNVESYKGTTTSIEGIGRPIIITSAPTKETFVGEETMKVVVPMPTKATFVGEEKLEVPMLVPTLAPSKTPTPMVVVKPTIAQATPTATPVMVPNMVKEVKVANEAKSPLDGLAIEGDFKSESAPILNEDEVVIHTEDFRGNPSNVVPPVSMKQTMVVPPLKHKMITPPESIKNGMETPHLRPLTNAEMLAKQSHK